MSTRIMAACAPLNMPSTAKFVLLALADQANDAGVCWPSLASLCEWTCLSERAVRNAIRLLQGYGVVHSEDRRRNNGSRTSNVYTVDPADYVAGGGAPDQGPETDLPGAEVESNFPPAGGQVDAQQPARRAGGERSATGTSCRGPRHVVPGFDPLYEPNTNTNPPNPPDGGRARADEPLVELATAIAAANLAGEKFMPADDPVFAYADRVGLGRDLLALHWREFKRRRGEARKRQRGLKGWRQAFRRSVEDNWFRLWFLRPGEPAQLTTQGLQAHADWSARDHAAATQPGAPA